MNAIVTYKDNNTKKLPVVILNLSSRKKLETDLKNFAI
jgi:hypothetical protein